VPAVNFRSKVCAQKSGTAEPNSAFTVLRKNDNDNFGESRESRENGLLRTRGMLEQKSTACMARKASIWLFTVCA